MSRLVSELEQAGERARRLRKDGEALALELARRGEAVKRLEISKQRDAIAASLAADEPDHARRQRAGRKAATVLDDIEAASLEIVKDEITRIEPALQQFWNAIDPHPALRIVNLVTRFESGRGRLVPSVADDLAGVRSDAPAAVLSSAQLAAFALALFLTLNISTAGVPVSAVMLDDPFQALDDINVLGLVDLLRRVRKERQLFLATHDPAMASLIARKLRPVSKGQRTLMIRVETWNREGPGIITEDVPVERQPFKFVA